MSVAPPRFGDVYSLLQPLYQRDKTPSQSRDQFLLPYTEKPTPPQLSTEDSPRMKLNVDVPQWPSVSPEDAKNTLDTTFMNVPPKAPLYMPEEPAYKAQQDLSMEREPSLDGRLLLIANTSEEV